MPKSARRRRVTGAADALTATVAVVLFSGCYLAHERGDTLTPDAGLSDAAPRDRRVMDAPPPRRDAAPREGSYWTLERRDGWLSIPHELGCTQYAGGRIAVQVTTPIMNDCEHAGPVDVQFDALGDVTLTAYLWVEHPLVPSDCLGVAAIALRTVLIAADEGPFRAVNAEGSSMVELRVGVIDDLPCSPVGERGAACVFDCQCEDGLLCIPDVGDFVACEGGHCGDPCDAQAGSLFPVYGQHLDCAPTESCLPGGGGAAFSCQRVEGGGCADDGFTCGAGLTCPAGDEPSECVWDIGLSAMARHPCGSDIDCDAGLHCVERGGGIKSCEVPCFTNGMTCPPMHECRGGTWVCEWIGE